MTDLHPTHTYWDGRPCPAWRDCTFCEGKGSMLKPNWFERKLSISFSICPICSGIGTTRGLTR